MKSLILFSLLSFTFSYASTSTVSLYAVSMELKGDTLLTTIRIEGTMGSDRDLVRLNHDFDPAYQSAALMEAEYGFPGSDFREIPSWAVDTLGGTGDWPLSLVTAFPGLREGMEIHYEISLKDWGGDWINGIWAVMTPYVENLYADSSVFTVTGDGIDRLRWAGNGFHVNDSGNMLKFSMNDSTATLWISPFDSHEQLTAFILGRAEEVLADPMPPDLREAALQAAAFGADEWIQIRAARSLLCNSLGLSATRGTSYDWMVRDLQEILNSRTGTPLELAVLFASMCTELGIFAEIVPVSEVNPLLPIPLGWNRFIVRAEAADGRWWLVEPSAYLSEAFYIYRPVNIYLLKDNDVTVMGPNPPMDNTVDEEWEIFPLAGRFSLRLHCRGWFDGVLRRRLAGLSEDACILAVSEWMWRSGKPLQIDSVSVSDFFDLGVAASVEISGEIWSSSDSRLYCDYLPSLYWNQPSDLPGNVGRSWRVHGVDSAAAGENIEILRSMGSILLIDSSVNSEPLPVLLYSINE